MRRRIPRSRSSVYTPRFPKLRLRTYAYNALPIPPRPPAPDAGIDKPLHLRGNDLPESIAPSLRVIGGKSAAAPRDFDTSNNADLNSGAPPVMIRRGTRAQDRGAIVLGTGPTSDGPPSLPGGGALFMPHQSIPRKPITVTAFRRTIDTSSTIPSIGVGAPVR